MIRTLKNTSLLFCEDSPYYTNMLGIVVDWVIFLVGRPEVCLACHALLNLVKKETAAPIFAINLLLSDLIQIGLSVVFIITRFFDATFEPFIKVRCMARMFVRLGLTSSLGFMLLISVERYLMVACPLWYHTNNNAKFTILISVCMWTLSLAYCSLDFVLLSHRYSLFLFSITCLLPAPFLVGLFIATWKALNNSTAMRHEKKNRRRVLGVLSLVLVTYIVLFCPFSVRNLYYSLKDDSTEDSAREWSGILTTALLYISPLIDCFIYIFIRKDIMDTIEAFPCCKKPLMKLKEFQEKVSGTSQTETTF